jgi:hypothetical protein
VVSVIVGLLAYYVAISWAVSICNKRELTVATSFWVGAISGCIFVFIILATGYIENGKVMLINGSVLYTTIAGIGVAVFGGIRCVEGRKKASG